jgi:molybdate transport system substrate-binding protein
VLAAWQPHLVQAENIAQTHQFVASGNARIGFVALSQVVEQGRIARGSAGSSRAGPRADPAGRRAAGPRRPQ